MAAVMVSNSRCPKAERMAVIRSDRRDADFAEVTIWLPKEAAPEFRDAAWEAIDRCGREFPHRAPEGQRTRDRRVK